MRVGVPREIKPQEFRVGLTPESVHELVRHGHEVFVEAGAGAGIGAGDEAYRRQGATVLDSAAEVFARGQLIVKVKEPQPAEWPLITSGQLLFTYLHLAPDPALTQALLQSGCSAIAYETVTDAQGGLPLLAPMSEVAGRLAAEAAAVSLRRTSCGKGKLMGGVPGVPPARVLVLGGGTVGAEAARVAAGMGAEVIVIDRSLPRLRQLDEWFGGRVRTRHSNAPTVAEEVRLADAVIGAVLVPGANAPRLVTRAMLATMQAGSVLVDVAIDQGGCFETSHPTTHEDPSYVVDGIVHYAVANMPGAVPITSSYALNHATLPYTLALAEEGLQALVRDPLLRRGLNVHGGRLTCEPVARAQGLGFVTPEVALGM